MTVPRHALASLAVAACIAVLAGCGRKPEEASTAPAAATAAAPAPAAVAAPASSPPAGVLMAYVWDCDDGTSLTMDNLLAERAISLQLPEGPRRLPQVIAGSGAKYDDGSLSFWTKGDTAMLQRNDGPVVNCRESRARSLLADARARGVWYRGVGNEPGWVLEVTPPDRLVFVTNYGQQRHEFTGAAVSGDAGPGGDYRATRDGEQIHAVVTPQPCQDDMAGTKFDYSVVVEFAGRTYRGCADSTR
jgi:membrane-bound inhibitor of C-type lysozyme